jgi:hypothetical protein
VVVRRNGTALTNSSGQFHVQPTTSTGCNATISTDLCVQSGAMATSGDDRNLRYDSAAAGTTIIPRSTASTCS